MNVGVRKDSTVKPVKASAAHSERTESPSFGEASEMSASVSEFQLAEISTSGQKVAFASEERPASRQSSVPSHSGSKGTERNHSTQKFSRVGGDSVAGSEPEERYSWRRRSTKKSHKTSLTAFVRDLRKRQRLHFCHDLEFADREQQFWHSSTSHKFQKWVTRVISRERSIIAEKMLDQALRLQRILGSAKAVSSFSHKYDLHEHRVSAFTEVIVI